MSDIIEQKIIFAKSEGDQWFNRNKQAYNLPEHADDEIVKLIKDIELHPQKVLEIGCSSGKRLSLIEKVFNAQCSGIDPSVQAIESGKKAFPTLSLSACTADLLPFKNNSFDTIIFGFCLYLCDRKDLFKIAYEADRCLEDNGVIIIKDFYPPFPYKNQYSHCENVFSYKMDYSKMFTWNPAYSEIFNSVSSHSGFKFRDIPDEKISITVLTKNERCAYPDAPFK